MGIRFDMGTANVVAYLTAPTGAAPRLRLNELEAFLNSFAHDHGAARSRLISSDLRWAHELRLMARKILHTMHAEITDLDYHDFVDPETVTNLLAPVARILGQYDVYILPVGSRQDSDVLDRFAHEAARLPGHGILVLIPDYYDGTQNAKVLDPAAGTLAAVKNRDLWPGVIFMLRTGEANFFPLDEAHSRLGRLAKIMTEQPLSGKRLMAVRELVREPSVEVAESRSVRILHLSDLHLGTQRTAATQTLLLANLKRQFDAVDQIVITGDLFDQPHRRHAQQFANFNDTLRLMSRSKPIIVPGNHDQRIFGNSLLGIGRKLRQLVDLEWRPLIIAPTQRLAFLCFDSSRTGDFARGSVDRDQLIRMATEFDVENDDGHLDGFLRVALVHHHPYPYTGTEASIVDPRSWVGREEFIELRGAPEFLTWCAGRGVTLILHGHKHVPRLVNDAVRVGDNDDYREMTTVGCGSSLGANGSPLSFNIVEWHPDTQTWSVDFKVDRGDGQGFASAAVEQVSLA